MATRVHEPLKIEEGRPRSRPTGPGDGGFRNLGPKDENLRAVEDYAPAPSRTGIWVIIASISMSFAGFTSALIVRQGASMDWQHLTLPRILYFNTLVLLASSVTLEVARRRTAVFMSGFKNLDVKTLDENPARWLYVTLFLGLIFVAGQYAAWLQLRSEGLFLATNPNSSFFYVLTAVHALHVLGGLIGLTYVMRKLNRVVLRRSTLDSFSYYWHFMGILWVYLLLLLWVKL
jgi:cytochrome c oxidase subunit III